MEGLDVGNEHCYTIQTGNLKRKKQNSVYIAT
jgi:hypothetical protein